MMIREICYADSVSVFVRDVSCLRQGHFVKKLGAVGDKGTENEVLLLEHDVPHSGFSEAVLGCLPTLPWAITDEASTRLLTDSQTAVLSKSTKSSYIVYVASISNNINIFRSSKPVIKM